MICRGSKRSTLPVGWRPVIRGAQLLYNKTDAVALHAKLNARSIPEFGRSGIPDGSTLRNAGVLQTMGHALPLKDKMLVNVVITVSSGLVVYTPGS